MLSKGCRPQKLGAALRVSWGSPWRRHRLGLIPVFELGIIKRRRRSLIRGLEAGVHYIMWLHQIVFVMESWNFLDRCTLGRPLPIVVRADLFSGLLAFNDFDRNLVAAISETSEARNRTCRGMFGLERPDCEVLKPPSGVCHINFLSAWIGLTRSVSQLLPP
jgi:hypothetical protein